MEYLSENIPTYIRQDVVKELKAQLNSPKVFQNLMQRDERLLIAANEKQIRELRKELNKILIRKPSAILKRSVDFPSIKCEVDRYFAILHELGFGKDCQGGISLKLDPHVLRNRISEINKIKIPILKVLRPEERPYVKFAHVDNNTPEGFIYGLFYKGKLYAWVSTYEATRFNSGCELTFLKFMNKVKSSRGYVVR